MAEHLPRAAHVESGRLQKVIGAAKAAVQLRPDDWRVVPDPAGHPFCLVLVCTVLVCTVLV